MGLDYGHFCGQRRWTDAQLADAVAASLSWSEVAQRLGLVGGSGATTLKGHAKRLDIDVGHFAAARQGRRSQRTYAGASVSHLPRAGSLLAAAWFALRGYDVSWPLEPCRYDLIATIERTPQRVQVKTTQTQVAGAWRLDLSSTRKGRVAYDPDDIDYFFAIDGDLTFYLIPVADVGGFQSIHLSAYTGYRLDRLELTG